MEGHRYLGIYLSKDTATVVCLGSKGKDHDVLACFSVGVEETEKQNPWELAGLIAEGCAERELKFSEVVVALDCARFMQHSVHSEFSDPKQIGQTIRFDAEEALAMDISDLAVAFRIISSDQSGSDLLVFTTERKQLSDILLGLQSNNIDPVSVEPDICCLSRFVLQNVSLPEDSRSLFCVLSGSGGYFVAFEGLQETVSMRTFLVSPTQDKGELLAREVPMTAALVGIDKPISSIKVFDPTNSVDCQQLGEKLSVEAESVDLISAVGTEPSGLADLADPLGFVLAYGAALSRLEKARSVNFRNDFMPYQGKKVRLQKAIKFSSIALVAFMLALGTYFQLQLFQKDKYRGQLHRKFEKEYASVMFGEKPPARLNPINKLKGEIRRIESVKKGLLSVTGEESISAKLTLVLEAFNRCAAKTNLNIDSVSITAKTISVTGDTSSRKNTLDLFEAVRKSGLEILQQRLDAKGGRDNFHITAEPRK
ncbi:MAG: hypothetical protein JSV82_07260 [Planctomycetota bacterium]|nr:MAG: hypothetical protein JSV82_07260 [Planctomycetota bacterium]